MPPVAFEPAILASERPHTHALDRAATGIVTNGIKRVYFTHFVENVEVLHYKIPLRIRKHAFFNQFDDFLKRKNRLQVSLCYWCVQSNV